MTEETKCSDKNYVIKMTVKNALKSHLYHMKKLNFGISKMNCNLDKVSTPLEDLFGSKSHITAQKC